MNKLVRRAETVHGRGRGIVKGGGGLYFLFLRSYYPAFCLCIFPCTHTRSTRYTNRSSSILPHTPHLPLSTTQGKYGTALILAARNGYVEAVKALVAADPDPAHLNMEDYGGDTALAGAIRVIKDAAAVPSLSCEGCAECAAVLRAAGAKE